MKKLFFIIILFTSFYNVFATDILEKKEPRGKIKVLVVNKDFDMKDYKTLHDNNVSLAFRKFNIDEITWDNVKNGPTLEYEYIHFPPIGKSSVYEFDSGDVVHILDMNYSCRFQEMQEEENGITCLSGFYSSSNFVELICTNQNPNFRFLNYKVPITVKEAEAMKKENAYPFIILGEFTKGYFLDTPKILMPQSVGHYQILLKKTPILVTTLSKGTETKRTNMAAIMTWQFIEKKD